MSVGIQLAPDTLFGRYRIVRLLGAGGMGAVYEATHVELEKRVALKVLLPSVALNPDARVRFLREARLTARLRHAHVVDVTDVGVEGETPFLVMEYLEGESLAALLDREGPLTPARLVDLILPVLAAVGAAHALGIVHRDLKPDNVFLARASQRAVVPKVLDFGISKLADRSDAPALTGTAALLGTPSYMSPEQAQGARDVDARSDQYAVGVMLYEAVTGRLPFLHETLYGLLIAIVSGPLVPPRTHRPELPEAFEAAVLRAMARDPADRFTSVHDLGLALLPFASAAARDVWATTFETRGVTLDDAVGVGDAIAHDVDGSPTADGSTTLAVTVRALQSPAGISARARVSPRIVAVAALTVGLVSAAVLVPSRPVAPARPAPFATERLVPAITLAPTVSSPPIGVAPDASVASTTAPSLPAAPLRLPRAATASRPRPTVVPGPTPAAGSALRVPVAAPPPSPADGTNQAPILE